MKKIIAFTLLSTLLACGSVNRTVFGTTEKNLIKTVAIEQNCSKEKIKIVDSIKGLHGATYSLDACGKRIVYKQVGSVFMESSKADKMIKEFSN
ncbi:hypothetical protein [Polaribacter sp.]|uniref:hypothetical protein n=1 Tax=Polaribacter sp. TaxID=1920175 RepID=UPI003EF32B5A